MFKLLYASLKYFALGLVIGLLTAPRPGHESRRLLQDQIGTTVQDWFSSLGGGRTRTTGTTERAGTTGTTGTAGTTGMPSR